MTSSPDHLDQIVELAGVHFDGAEALPAPLTVSAWRVLPGFSCWTTSTRGLLLRTSNSGPAGSIATALASCARSAETACVDSSEPPEIIPRIRASRSSTPGTASGVLPSRLASTPRMTLRHVVGALQNDVDQGGIDRRPWRCGPDRAGSPLRARSAGWREIPEIPPGP